MQTATEQLGALGKSLVEAVAEQLGDDVPLRDTNADHLSGVVFIGASYAFPKLTLEQKRFRSQVLGMHQRFFALARTLLRGQPADPERELEMWEREVREVVEQEYLVYHSSTGEALERVRENVTAVMDLVSQMHDPTEGGVILVPDTNALIGAPAFQNWAFPDITEFELLLTPTILHELDELKTRGQTSTVRQKSQSIERQIKECARRGVLSDGVVVTKGRIRLRSVAVEPRLADALPWLDPTVQDDRLLASTLETMRLHPRSVIMLVTSDLNLQNKASFAGIPFLEPPSQDSDDSAGV